MWKLTHTGDWAPKDWCFWTVVLEKTLESPLDCKEIKLVSAKGNQPWIFIVRTDAEAEAPIFWPPDVKNWLIGKDPDAGKDWWLEEKGATEDEMVGWHHQLNGHEFEQTLGDNEGQESLMCWSPWGCKKLDTNEWLKNTNVPEVKHLIESKRGISVSFTKCVCMCVCVCVCVCTLTEILRHGDLGKGPTLSFKEYTFPITYILVEQIWIRNIKPLWSITRHHML